MVCNHDASFMKLANLRLLSLVSLRFLLTSGAVWSVASSLPAQEVRPLRQPPQSEASSNRPVAEAKLDANKITLPPLPEGVVDLDFRDFFKTPVGDYGLELTERLQSLDGKRVRFLGYMVYEDLTRCNSCTTVRTMGGRPIPAWMEATVPGRMMFTSRPASVSHAHYGLADDLPPQTVFVTVPDKIGQLVPYTPGPMLITGILSVGSKKEMDGRVSIVRLELDLPDSPPLASSTSSTALPSSH